MTLTEARKLVHLLVGSSSSFCTECDEEGLKRGLQEQFPFFEWSMMWREAEHGINLHTGKLQAGETP